MICQYPAEQLTKLLQVNLGGGGIRLSGSFACYKKLWTGDFNWLGWSLQEAFLYIIAPGSRQPHCMKTMYMQIMKK
jgi:hypothetical protein